MIYDTYHVGRRWSGHSIEDQCGCEQKACGLVVLGQNPDCPQHQWDKTIRQGHRAEDCLENVNNN